MPVATPKSSSFAEFVPTLSTVLGLGLGERMDGDALTRALVDRAEEIAPILLATSGVLLNRREALYGAVEEVLSADNEREYMAEAKRLLDRIDRGERGEDDDCASDAACNLYTPKIEAAYLLGLVMGWRAAQLAGGAR